MANERALFVTKLGGILAAVGSAVGLGNIWRFPTETGANGGAAFILIYLLCVLLLGTPLMLAELSLGRTTHLNPVGTYRKLSPGTSWPILGYLGAIAQLLVLGFYSVVAGWTLYYAVSAILDMIPDFAQFSTSLTSPLFCTVIFIMLNTVIVLGGVQKGIERASNIMMPVLGLLLVILCANSLLLPGAADGLSFLFHPDFTKIDASVVVSAMGQSFFSISVGIGCLLTYGSYLTDKTNMGKTALSITLLDTLIAILSGVVIFPACFSYGVMPDAGPGLAFITLPEVFSQMLGGYFWCVLFFLLLSLAALTSTISMFETPIAIFHEEFHMTRRKSVLATTGIGLFLGVLCSFSFCPVYSEQLSVFGMTFFDLFDNVTANYLMPGCGMLMALYVGWILPREKFEATLTNNGTTSGWYVPAFYFVVRYFAPLCILLIFLSGLGVF